MLAVAATDYLTHFGFKVPEPAQAARAKQTRQLSPCSMQSPKLTHSVSRASLFLSRDYDVLYLQSMQVARSSRFRACPTPHARFTICQPAHTVGPLLPCRTRVLVCQRAACFSLPLSVECMCCTAHVCRCPEAYLPSRAWFDTVAFVVSGGVRAV